MRRILLRVAYDGTNYCGWQLQPNGVTIESKLNEALRELLGEPQVAVTGAGRTDAGVHSLGNVAVFDTESRIPADKFPYALNARLPQDIRVQAAEEVELTFHPRKQNSIKTYEYRILNRRLELPLERSTSYFCHVPLDVEAMKEAGALLIGEHDFGAFCSAGSQAEDTIRRIYDLQVTKRDDIISIRVSGNGFLYNMVRIIAGTLIEVGSGRFTKEDVKQMLLTRDRRESGRKVPAKGLTMVSIVYQEETFPQHIQSDTWAYDIEKKSAHAMAGEKNIVWIRMKYCETPEECNTLTGKLINHAYRDGADAVYVGGECSFIGGGYQPGYYELCADEVREADGVCYWLAKSVR